MVKNRTTYLQTAEDGKQVVEGHDITVNSHQTQQPGGANEQQEQKGHPQSKTGAHLEKPQ